MTAPRALVVTSHGSSPEAVVPVLAALEVAGLDVRAIDVGRIGSRETGTVDRVMKAIVGEFAERRLSRELQDNPPDVAVAFDPGSAAALSEARDHLPRPAPVVAVVAELSPGPGWRSSDADRFLTIDDEAAVALSDVGVPGERIIPVGPIGEVAFAEAATRDRATARKQFKLPASGLVVLVEVAGLGYDISAQVALQLSLIERPATYLFAAGNDSQAATALRTQVPALGMKAKLFGDTPDAPMLWRCANVVVARPRPTAVARALLVGARVVAFSPDDEQGRRLAIALEGRGVGQAASNALLISAALEPMLASTGDVSTAGEDGAANIADIVWVVGSEREAVLDQRDAAARARTRARVDSVASAAEASARATSAPGELEDLSGDGFDLGDAGEPEGPDLLEIARLRRELGVRMERLQRAIADAQKRSQNWQKKHESSKKSGATDMAREAERNADLERARMHSALAEMAQIEQEIKRLDAAEKAAHRSRPRPTRARPGPGRRRGGGTSVHAASSVDDLLEQMKRQSGSGGSGNSSATKKKRKKKKQVSGVDDELAALKRKMASKNRRKP